MQFYIFFASLVLALNWSEGWGWSRDRTFLALAAFLVLVSALQITHLIAVPIYLLPYHLHTFLGGIFAALAFLKVRGAFVLFWVQVGTMVFGFVCSKIPDVLASLASALIVGAAVAWWPLTRLLSAPLLLWLGALSYCIYLFHMLVGGLAIELLQAFVSRTSGLHQLVFVVAGIFTTIAFPHLYLAVERPVYFHQQTLHQQKIRRPVGALPHV